MNVQLAPMMRADAPASPKVRRILATATPLILAHGVRKVTMAEIARAAGVGKGTAYQYWATKEDLILDLATRDAIGCLDDVVISLEAEPERLTFGRTMRLVVEAVLAHPVATRLLQRTDAQLLALVAERTWARDGFKACSPPALCGALLPILRTHGFVGTTFSPDEQVFAAVSMLFGFLTTITATDGLTANQTDTPVDVFERAVQSVLGSAESGQGAEEEATTALVAELRRIRAGLLVEHCETFR